MVHEDFRVNLVKDGIYHLWGELRTSTDWETGIVDEVWFAGELELLQEVDYN